MRALMAPLLSELLGRPEWQSQAACRGMPARTFVVAVGTSTAVGRGLCEPSAATNSEVFT